MREIAALVSGEIRLQGLPEKTAERLRQAFSFPNPKHVMLTSFGRFAGNEPATIEGFFEEPNGDFCVPRGAVEVVRAALSADGLRPVWNDGRAMGNPLFEEEKPKVSLRSYQETAVQEIVTRRQGTVVIGCGGGKTRLGIASIAEINRTTLILVHTADLLAQWVEGIRDLLGLEAGVVAEGKADWKPVTVAIIDTLTMRIDQEREAIQSFGFCIVDEAHHAPSATYQDIFPCIPAAYRLGLTATPEREDKMTKLMDWSFGPRLLEMRASDLIRDGYLMRPALEIVGTAFDFNVNSVPMNMRNAALTDAVVNDEARNELICSIAAREVHAGETVVILSNHRAHCKLLADILRQKGTDPHVVVAEGASKAAKARRHNAIQGMRDGNVRLILATSLFDEGINIDRLSRLILALPQKAKGSTEQKIGRLMRLFEGKKPKVYDLVDDRVSTLVRRWHERKRVYQNLGML